MSSAHVSLPAYTDLEIRLLPPEPEGYPVEITLGAGQQFPRGRLGHDVLPWAPSGSPAADGERLFDLLLADDRLKTAWAEARGRNPARRIRLRIDDGAPELHAIPWELLRDAGPGVVTQTLAADVDTPFSRYLAGPWHVRAPVRERPFALLVAVADPSDLPDYGLAPVDVRAEQEVIRTACQGVGQRELRITFLESPVTLAGLEAELRNGYHALHIVAHGTVSGDGEAGLFLADDANRVAVVREDELAEMLARQGESLQLVLLAACQSAARSPADAFRGFAPKLIAAGIPAVLAMQDAAPVEASRKFTGIFYRQLLQHGQVDLASNEARSGLFAEQETWAWGVPALYSRVQDGLILEPARPPGSPWERVRRLPAVAKGLAAGGAILSVLSVLAMLLSLPDTVQSARRPGGALGGIWPAPTATLTPTPAPTPTATLTPFPSPTPLLPMKDNAFNVAVAEFTALDEPSTHVTRKLSQWLFDALQDQLGQVPDVVADFRGPDQIGAVAGTQPEARGEDARRLAELHNATLLIYGSVVTAADGSHYMQPEFRVSSKGFDYGSEVAGPDRLGEKVRFAAEPLSDPATVGEINLELQARLRVLQRLSVGLVYYYLGRYRLASGEFGQASAEWGVARGREVVDALKGAAELRLYDEATAPATRRDALEGAAKSFSDARELNPDYARSYLGLGAVAIQQAAMTTTAEARQSALIAAQLAYSNSLTARDQPALAYVDAKAAYGLGQTHLVGLESGFPGWSAEQARQNFGYVLRVYNDRKQPPDLTWFAGHARAFLGRLAERDGDWPEMAAGYREAIGILSRMPGGPPANWVARYWAKVAVAEEKQGNLQDARDAYRMAIENGQKTLGAQRSKAVEPDEVAQWQNELGRLEKGTP